MQKLSAMEDVLRFSSITLPFLTKYSISLILILLLLFNFSLIRLMAPPELDKIKTSLLFKVISFSPFNFKILL